MKLPPEIREGEAQCVCCGQIIDVKDIRWHKCTLEKDATQ